MMRVTKRLNNSTGTNSMDATSTSMKHDLGKSAAAVADACLAVIAAVAADSAVAAVAVVAAVAAVAVLTVNRAGNFHQNSNKKAGCKSGFFISRTPFQ